MSPCLKCKNASVCTACIAGYYLSGTSCVQCTSSCQTCFDPTQGLQAYYKFDGSASNALLDSSGNSNTLTVENSPTWGSSTGYQSSGGFYFTAASNQNAVLPQMTFGTDFSFFAWINMNSYQNFNRIITLFHPTNNLQVIMG